MQEINLVARDLGTRLAGDRCDKNKRDSTNSVCFREQYTRKRLSSLFRAYIFAAQRFIFSFAILIFLGGNISGINDGIEFASGTCLNHLKTNTSVTQVRKAGRYVVDEGEKCQ